MADATLDATGLICPLPVLKARKALRALAPGATLEVRATDPNAAKDFRAFCEATGDELAGSSESAGVYTFLIRRRGR